MSDYICIVPQEDQDWIKSVCDEVFNKVMRNNYPDWECQNWLRYELRMWRKLELKVMPEGAGYNFWNYYIDKDGEVRHK